MGYESNDGRCDYKFEYNQKQEGEYILYQRKPKKDWKQIYSFSLEPQLDIDYVLPSFYCESHPNSPFINSMKVARYTEDEHIRFFDIKYILLPVLDYIQTYNHIFHHFGLFQLQVLNFF